MSPEAAPKPLTAEDLAPVIERLDAVIGLLARIQPVKERGKVAVRIRLLSQLGLDNVAIARIVGRGSNYIGAVLGPRKKTTARKGAGRARKPKARR